MAKRTSTIRTTFAATAVLVLFAVVVPWGPGCLGCELDTSPRIHRHPPVDKPSRDDDSGEDIS
jgi:hypothetical protein